VGRPLYENVLDGYGQIKFNTLSGQLADIGVTPANIDYLVLSHYHWDHIGNAGNFAGSTWLVYKGDRDRMFSSAARAYPWFSQYSALENSKTTLLSGDYDVFGDGTVVVLATPGHTEGHCSLLVRLKNTGPIVLSGDLYHYAEERDLRRMPDEEKTTGTVESRQKVEELLRRTGAQLWIGHSMEFFRAVRTTDYDPLLETRVNQVSGRARTSPITASAVPRIFLRASFERLSFVALNAPVRASANSSVGSGYRHSRV
jgi:N-acyl homoserine lactone hydrolase